MQLLIKFPTRARPDVFCSTLKTYRSLLSGRQDVHFRVSLDADDKTMNNPAMLQWLTGLGQLSWVLGHSKSKVEAINADLAGMEFDVLLLASDDMVPVAFGYDDTICSDMAKNFPNLDGVLHYNDGRRGRELNTLSIMGRRLYEQWGYIYHPDYASLWCDDEFQQVSERAGKSVYIDQLLIKHAWRDVTGRDYLHIRNEKYFERDKMTFEVRRDRGFPRESCLQHVTLPLPPPPTQAELNPPKPPAPVPPVRHNRPRPVPRPNRVPPPNRRSPYH